MFKFKASYVALAAVLTSSVVYADPTSYTHSSGATVIDIEKPNAAGVSHNLYRDGNDSNLLIVFYVQIMPDDFVMQLHRF